MVPLLCIQAAGTWLRSHLLKSCRDLWEGSSVSLEGWEEVINQRQEEGHIFSHKFGHVHVTQATHHQKHLRPAGTGQQMATHHGISAVQTQFDT